MSQEVREHVLLAPYTTFKLGGEARGLIEVESEEGLQDAIAQLRNRDSSYAVLGGGSNVLVPDTGLAGTVIRIAIPGIALEPAEAGRTRIVLGAGVAWEDAVDAALARELWGIENLAGIPGTAGGAGVQNIGAYGAELADIFEYADVIDMATGEAKRVMREDARFAYRDSIFKHERSLVITRVGLLLSEAGAPNLVYKDLQTAAAQGTSLSTPIEIAAAVRGIRAGKFPDLAREGTAGSFFKNPIVSRELAEALVQEYPGLPSYQQANGETKLSLAWILDHVLGLKGLAQGSARLFERQPLVITTSHAARAEDVESLARTVEEKVFAATRIRIEREVETFAVQKLSTHQ